MSYYIVKYEFIGQDSGGLQDSGVGRVSFRSASSSSLSVCLDGFFR
eukprot:COSAG01_NODE_60067_length_296_cov_1.619289_1_plen_45_part_01